AVWGMSPDQVQENAVKEGWNRAPDEEGKLPENSGINVYVANEEVAGYNAEIKYYFFNDKFYQAFIDFDFSELENFDFNYNVFRSVNEYYTAIHDRTITFINDIYSLLQKKYGKKQPVFKGLDPKRVFVQLDKDFQRDIWNLRYHPYEYYRRIVTSAYALWKFPDTEIAFSINISAEDKRFEYTLSFTSTKLKKRVENSVNQNRMRDF
ncbi:MAG: hypothetical protein ACOCSE_01820, partial [Chitinivibrionales bacterium]